MTRFRKKPVEIDAWLWDGSELSWETVSAEAARDTPAQGSVVFSGHIAHLWDYDGGCYILPNGKCVFAPPPSAPASLIVLTIDGNYAVVQVGSYLVKGVQGELYPCKPDIFTDTNEEVR